MNPQVAGCGRRKTGGSKAARELIDAIKAAGGQVVAPAKAGHYKVYLDDKLIATIPSTPSDIRSYRNAIAQLRRAGLPLTTKGRPANG